MSDSSAANHLRPWRFGPVRWQTGEFPKLMGILNATPDSFSDGGEFFSRSAAVEHGLRLIDEGADVIDLGGESTRPGADPVTERDELARVIPVIEELSSRIDVPISIDTTKAKVAEEALNSGASIVNDISGLTFDPRMIDVCAASDCGVIAMHIKGTPQTMQNDPRYDDAVREIRDWLLARLTIFQEWGIDRERVMLDPGIGFGKTAEHNLQLLSSVDTFRATGVPVLIGHSRKGFLKTVLGRDVDQRLFGTVGVAVALAAQHTDMIRVHDVRAVRDTLLGWRAVTDRVR